MDEAVALIGQWMLTTASSISRLEQLQVVPTGPRSASRRQRAYMLCLCYEVDPADFDLDPEDLPPGWEIPARTHNPDGTLASTNWLSGTRSIELRVAA